MESAANRGVGVRKVFSLELDPWLKLMFIWDEESTCVGYWHGALSTRQRIAEQYDFVVTALSYMT